MRAGLRAGRQFAAVFLLSHGGCGYHTSGHAVRLPDDIHTLYVPMFDNTTQTFRVEQTMTAAVVQELRSRTNFRVVTSRRRHRRRHP